MIYLVIGIIIFIATHSLRIFADDWRSQMLTRLGVLPWKGLNSVVTIAGIAFIAYGYGIARQAPIVLWSPPIWISHLVSLLMLVSMIFLLAAYVPGNGIKSRVGHPMVIAVKIWAFSHLLANGSVADLILFGTLLAWAAMSFRAARQRDRRDGVGRPPAELLKTMITVVGGALVWVWFVFQGHAWLIGVRPLVMGASA